MLENRADLAVHSLKDVPALLPEGLELSVILTLQWNWWFSKPRET